MSSADALLAALEAAEQFCAAGIDDILYAVAIVPVKFAMRCAWRAPASCWRCWLGSAAAARLLTEHGQRHGHLHQALIEIDTDDHRCGIPPQADALLQGGGRSCSTVAARRAVAGGG